MHLITVEFLVFSKKVPPDLVLPVSMNVNIIYSAWEPNLESFLTILSLYHILSPKPVYSTSKTYPESF